MIIVCTGDQCMLDLNYYIYDDLYWTFYFDKQHLPSLFQLLGSASSLTGCS